MRARHIIGRADLRLDILVAATAVAAENDFCLLGRFSGARSSARLSWHVSSARFICKHVLSLATIILLNDNDNDGALVLLARIQPGVVHLPRQPRLGLPPSTIVRAFLQVQDGGSSFFYRAPRRPLQQKIISSRNGICSTKRFLLIAPLLQRRQ